MRFSKFVELSFAAAGEQTAFMHAVSTRWPPMTAAHWENAPARDGNVRTTIDFIRQGFPILGADEAPR
jgi:hypothetical protein